MHAWLDSCLRVSYICSHAYAYTYNILQISQLFPHAMASGTWDSAPNALRRGLVEVPSPCNLAEMVKDMLRRFRSAENLGSRFETRVPRKICEAVGPDKGAPR